MARKKHKRKKTAKPPPQDDTQTTIKPTSESFEVHVDPLVPLWKKRALNKAEELRKRHHEQKITEKRLKKKMEKLELLNSDYLRYLKERENKELNKFHWATCCYKSFCCWREKPAEAYFEYKPRMVISPEVLEEYRKPYGVSPEYFYKMAMRAGGYDKLGWDMEGVSICSCDPVGEMLIIPDLDPKHPQSHPQYGSRNNLQDPGYGASPQEQEPECNVKTCVCK